MTKEFELFGASLPPLQPSEKLTSSMTPYKVYTSRWVMLVVLCLLNVSLGSVYVFAVSPDSTAVFFRITSLQMNVLTIVISMVTVVLGFPATWVIDTYGLRSSLLIAAWLNGLGSLLRNVSTFSGVPDGARYPVLLTGHIVVVAGTPFVMCAPTKLAMYWFPHNRRSTANMLGIMTSYLGHLLTYLTVPLIVNRPEDMPTALWAATIPALVMMAVTTLSVRRSVPPTPPSGSAATQTEAFLQGLRQLIRNKNYWLLNTTFGLGTGIYTSVMGYLVQMLCPRGYTDDFAGFCGALMIVVGILSASLVAMYVERTKRFEEVAKIFTSLAVLAGIAFTEVSRLRDRGAAVAVVIALIGFFILSVAPVFMELAVEVTYPVPAATSSGLCYIAGHVYGTVLMFVMQAITTPLPAHEAALGTACQQGTDAATAYIPQDWTVPNLYVGNLVSSLVVVVFVLFFKARYRRMEAEKMALKGLL